MMRSVDKNTCSRHMADYAKTSVGAVILSPTRELATQIAGEAIRMVHHLKEWDVQLFIGGANKMRQLQQFRMNRRDIVVATPGRMLDLLETPMIQEAVSKAKFLAFDEADTLLDMGFTDQIKAIVAQLPPKEKRQTFMFSATVSKEIRQIAKATLRTQHTFIDTVPANEANTHLHIPQYHTVLPSAAEQIPHIFRLLAQDALLHPEGGKAIIFLPTTKMTELFAIVVSAMRASLPWGVRNTKVYEMHSKKSQNVRDRTSDVFRSSKGPGYSILVTSDISARGVDYPGVTRVIQVGIPPNKEGYVHRVGRTGRAGKSGRGDLVLLPWESDYIPWQLQNMSLKHFSTSDLEGELERLAAEFDAKGAQPAAASSLSSASRSSYSSSPSPSIQIPVLPRIQAMPTKIKEEILPELSETEIHDTFAAQLGFYAGHAHEMHVPRSHVLKGLKEWTVNGLGLERAPELSASFLSKIGVREGSSSHFGRSRTYGESDRKRDGYEFVRQNRMQSGDRSRSGFGSSFASPRGRSFDGSDEQDYGRRQSFSRSDRTASERPGFRSRGSSGSGYSDSRSPF